MSLLTYLKRSQAYMTYSKDFNFHRRIEWNLISSWLEPKADEKICDIGCGYGVYCRKLAEQGVKVIGVDIDKEALVLANRYNRTKRNQFVLGNAEKLPIKSGSFDKAYLVSALEHINNDQAALQELNRILKPRACLVMSVDSLSHVATSNKFKQLHKKNYLVNHYYTVSDLKPKLEKHNFIVEKYQYILNSRLSNFFYELDHAVLTFFVSYPISKIADRLFGTKESGGMLVIKARKIN